MTSNASAAKAFQPPWRRLASIWPFLAIAGLSLLLNHVGLQVMTGMRAFVSAESLWSKAVKTAVGQLERYSSSGDEQAYQAYLAEMAVAVGMRNARIELDRPDPNLDGVRSAFRDARNHPSDVESMIGLFRRFRNVGFMATAITIWAQIDAQSVELESTASALHATISAGNANPAHVQALASRVRAIDDRLTPWEESFSATIEEASREAASLLALANLAFAIALVLVAAARARGFARAGNPEGHARASEKRLDHAQAALPAIADAVIPADVPARSNS